MLLFYFSFTLTLKEGFFLSSLHRNVAFYHSIFGCFFSYLANPVFIADEFVVTCYLWTIKSFVVLSAFFKLSHLECIEVENMYVFSIHCKHFELYETKRFSFCTNFMNNYDGSANGDDIVDHINKMLKINLQQIFNFWVRLSVCKWNWMR